jgi:FtsZ-binding cell division protein ZapB
MCSAATPKIDLLRKIVSLMTELEDLRGEHFSLYEIYVASRNQNDDLLEENQNLKAQVEALTARVAALQKLVAIGEKGEVSPTERHRWHSGGPSG